MNDGFLIGFRVNFPHLERKLIHSDKIDTENDDETEHVLNKDRININAWISLWSESLKCDLGRLRDAHIFEICIN